MERKILFYYQIMQERSLLSVESGEHVSSFEGVLSLDKLNKLKECALDEIKKKKKSLFGKNIVITGSIVLES